MNPAKVNQVNNIRLETLICFLAIIVLRIAYFVLRITHDASHTTHNESFPSVFVVVHRILPQLQIFKIDTGTASYAA